jgi:hypothetical protein
MSHADVARKYHVTDVTAGLIRRNAGVVAVRGVRRPKPTADPKPAAPKPMPVPRAGAIPSTTALALPRSQTLQITVNEEMLAAWFTGLPFEMKTQIFSSTWMTPFTGGTQ